MKRLIKISLVALSIVLFHSCVESSFHEVEYFKDEQKNRVYCIVTDIKDTALLKDYVSDRLMHTQGSITQAYFYKDASTIRPISQAENVSHAFENVAETKFFAKVYYDPKGELNVKIVD
jgi:hypothetical protein